jgi:hypothetical protein
MLDKPAELNHCHSDADRIPFLIFPFFFFIFYFGLRWGGGCVMKKEDVANRKEMKSKSSAKAGSRS